MGFQRFEGKLVIVTGAGSGMGAVTARRFRDEGAAVVLTGRTREKLTSVSQPAYPLPDYAWFCLCISLCILGCVIMIAADGQKYFTLRLQRGLITDGLYRYIRHPNYLGEMMIYGSFALMVWHWIPVVVLAWIWGGMFAVNMRLKEASMSRYPEWAQYKQRSWWLLPLVL